MSLLNRCSMKDHQAIEVQSAVGDFLLPHETWVCNPTGISMNTHCFPTEELARSVVGDRGLLDANTERFDLSEWIDTVAKQLSDNTPTVLHEKASATQSDALALPSNDSSTITEDYMPKKRIRKLSEAPDPLVHCKNMSQDLPREHTESSDEGMLLLSHLLECAVAISVDDLVTANSIALELGQSASPYRPSSAERVVAYFARAMASRIMNSWLGICTPLHSYKATTAAFQTFHTVSPFVKFAYLASNQAILEAFEDRERVHIIDVDIMHGSQWPTLLHALATRVRGPPHVRMTGLGVSLGTLEETGKQLSCFARRLGMHFEFQPVAKRFSEVEMSVLQGRRAEAVAVHWLQHSSYDAIGSDHKALSMLKDLAPKVVTLAEQEMARSGPFLERFVGALHYYSSMFDALAVSLPHDNPDRHRVEHDLLSREVTNVLAVGGPARSGEVKFSSWRAELLRNCQHFTQVPLSSNTASHAQLVLNMLPSSHGYTLFQGDGTLKLGWKDTSLYTASAWTSNAWHHFHFL
ncbi:protein SCARECROW [Amborella trichopoda]|uniref:Uncharacterized protein n=1 Tax=Amborella trichopoda TaxID=13333 RepID=U5CXD5_AMBTC|nr:protein SCARECROW [Amborella trichopoda]ERM97548.1 hypothetical protein AMTR_s04794p00002520 [Amborella trichopoda]|eukprot:XP_006830132.3 protein SCARECROW [Amborella trichopoda]